MHDAIIGERLGLPSVGIITAPFESAAQLMARVLGAEGYRFVLTDHPISSAGEAALTTWARRALDESLPILLA